MLSGAALLLPESLVAPYYRAALIPWVSGGSRRAPAALLCASGLRAHPPPASPPHPPHPRRNPRRRCTTCHSTPCTTATCWRRWRSWAQRTTGLRGWRTTQRASPRCTCTARRGCATGASCWARWRACAGGLAAGGLLGAGARLRHHRRQLQLALRPPSPRRRYNVSCDPAAGAAAGGCGVPAEQVISGVAQAGPRRGCDLQAQLDQLRRG
jgi:hypothetical protein